MKGQAKDIITTNVVCVNPEASLKDIIKKFSEHNISGLPVLDDQKNLIGIITESDVLEYYRKQHSISSFDAKGWVSPYERTWEKHDYREGSDLLKNTKVREVMTKKVITAKLTCSISEIARIMKRRKINHLIILDEYGKIAGIIARTDIINYIASID